MYLAGVMDILYRAATRLDLQAARSWELGNAAIKRLLGSAQAFSRIGRGDELLHERSPHDASPYALDLSRPVHPAVIPWALVAK